MSEKYYIVHYPSSRGMGSHTNISLVSESNLYRIIETEVDKLKSSVSEGQPICYNERFVGAWRDEIFCDSSDIKEVIADVMQKRLTTCSTYANVNDWILLPDEIPIDISEEKVFTYSELFQKGVDVSYLMADWTRDVNDVNEFNKMDVSKVLYNVFLQDLNRGDLKDMT